ncbi:2-hydroxy-6-oxo-6-phenylhexa-2,4-dienoate hydrolase [Sphaerisporangium rufum]|uniref:2-hydroxy-6-oxo-6-phenylhexa-2,4-dienoate hydrolase n=1 Tax=Sphaerisporangium rufum TaxID=1381558 RepID=A0A919UVZ3_9ACTN|nr:2-hydroxy-6-oxo-6-phenylhexa-2,4-dienoate hydrolase [Sphaerisporangium rufum]
MVVLPWFTLDGAVAAEAFEPAFAGLPGYRRVYVDLPGTGGSAPVAPDSDAVLAAVSATVDAVAGDEPVLLAGCSYGGYLAAGLTRRRPERVAALLLVCSGVKITPAERDLSGVLSAEPEPGWLDGVPGDLRGHFAAALGRRTREVADRMADAFAANAPTDDAYLTRLRSEGYRVSDEGSPGGYAGPVTILTGRRDQVAGYRDQFAALAAFPDGEYTALADVGHYLPFEQPERFAALLRDWLARTT